MAEYDYDLFIIGAGSGGVRASRIAAGYGAKVAVAEEYRVGGTCVIRGCVPKKMLVYGAHFAEDLQDAKSFGWSVENCTFDWAVLRDNVLADVDRLNGLYTQTLENHEVEIIAQRATVTGPQRGHAGRRHARSPRSTSSSPPARGRTCPSCPGHEHGITSNEAFHLDALPQAHPDRRRRLYRQRVRRHLQRVRHPASRSSTAPTSCCAATTSRLRDRLLQISLMKGIQFRFNAEFRGIEKLESGALKVSMTGHDDLEVDA